MKMAFSVWRRFMDVIDALFDAVGAIYRVAARGAFAPDGKAFKGSRYLELAAADVLIQEVAVNAADAEEAKRAIALDLEQMLPFAPQDMTFDVVGPLPEPPGPRSRPERLFILGAAHLDRLASRRAQALGAAAMEAFVFRPAQLPNAALVFRDASNHTRRRLRRFTTIIAMAALVAASADAYARMNAEIEQRVAAVQSDRTLIERRLRIAERRLAAAQANASASARDRAIPLSVVLEDMARLSRRQPQSAETTRFGYADRAFVWSGRAYDTTLTELDLRRGFEGRTVSFATQAGEAPQAFEASIQMPEGARP